MSALQSKDADLENLRDMMDAFQAQDVQAAKFIELSKKVRHGQESDTVFSFLGLIRTGLLPHQAGLVPPGTWMGRVCHT